MHAYFDPPLRLKVAYVLKRYPRLSETFILNEILELERRGVEVEIYSLMRPLNEVHHALHTEVRAPVFYLPRTSAMGQWQVGVAQKDQDLGNTTVDELCRDWPSALKTLFTGLSADEAALLWMQAATLSMLVTSRGVDHMHAHFGSNATTVAELASQFSGIPFSYTAHAKDIYHTYSVASVDDQRRQQTIAKSSFLVTVSDYNLRHLSKLAGSRHAGKLRRLYNGIDLKRFHPSKARHTQNHFLAVGRLVEKKGFAYLIEACRYLEGRGHHFRCTIIGDGPQREALSRQIKDTGLANVVSLVGEKSQQQVMSAMENACAFILPCVVSSTGDRDGLPTVLLEAMAMGLPTISTRVAGIPEIIDNGKTGILVNPESAGELCEAMEGLLLNPELQLQMGSAGRQKAERDFDLRKSVATLHDYFIHGGVDCLATEEKHDAYRVHFGR